MRFEPHLMRLVLISLALTALLSVATGTEYPYEFNSTIGVPLELEINGSYVIESGSYPSLIIVSTDAPVARSILMIMACPVDKVFNIRHVLFIGLENGTLVQEKDIEYGIFEENLSIKVWGADVGLIKNGVLAQRRGIEYGDLEENLSINVGGADESSLFNIFNPVDNDTALDLLDEGVSQAYFNVSMLGDDRGLLTIST